MKFAINANANLDTSLAYHILLSKNVFIKNNAIPIQYQRVKTTSEEVNTHQKKNNSKETRSQRLINSNIRSNRTGHSSNHSCNEIFHFGTFNFLNILSHANILRTEILAVCCFGISRF